MRRRPTLARSFTLTLIITLTLSSSLLVGVPSSVWGGGPCWSPPVEGLLVEHYETPACPYCAGNRGLQYLTARGATVRSVQAGTVTFSGRVVDTSYVVVEHGDGWKLTYGQLDAVRVRLGDAVARGTQLGVTTGRLYFGLRVDGAYRDPEPHLGALVGRPRLVPVDGTPRRATPTPRLTCSP